MDMLRALSRDLTYALRGLRNAPAFTAVAILTLALGIGANSAIFSVVNGVLLRPLPYAAPDRLVFLYSQFPTLGFDKFWISPPELRGLQERLDAFEAIGGWRTGAVNVAGDDDAVRVPSALATAEFFTALGVAPLLGRTYTVEEDVAGDPVVVISWGLWQRAFGGDRGIIGRTIDADGQPRTVIGVMPADFDIEDAAVDVWVPAAIPEAPTNYGSHYLNLVGRLRAGATLAVASPIPVRIMPIGAVSKATRKSSWSVTSRRSSSRTVSGTCSAWTSTTWKTWAIAPATTRAESAVSGLRSDSCDSTAISSAVWSSPSSPASISLRTTKKSRKSGAALACASKMMW